MTRAVFLPFCGDPILLNFWLKFYSNIWRGEVDKLYILLNADIPVDVAEYCVKLVEQTRLTTEDIWLEVIPSNMDHGPAINKMLQVCTEDLIMLIEEDGFIFKKGQVDKCFKLIESGEFDIIGSPRGSCGTEIWDTAQIKWGLSYEGYGDQGPNFWPNFFFCKREDLLKTNRHFAGKSWSKGEKIEELNHTVEADICPSDTFVWASLQLRNMGLKIKTIPQYHGYPSDLYDFVHQRNIFDGKCPWFHIGSLSGWQNALFNPDLPKMAGSPEEWERRVQFWLTFWENSDPEKIKEFRDKYKVGIDRLIKEYNLSLLRIRERQKIYKQVLESAGVEFL